VTDLERVKKFFVYAESLLRGKQDPSLATLLSEIDTMLLYDISMSFSGSESKTGVRVMTAHRSKGREYEYVFVPFCRDGYWGGKTKRSLFTVTVGNYANRELSGSIDDERRLFYVALTRAKKHGYLSTSARNAEGREFIHSVFIDEISEGLIESVDVTEIEKALAENPVLITESKPNPIGKYEEEFLRKLFLERGLSVTALNNYLKCSWNFFYKNLLRVPSVYTKQQSFGNAVHYAFDRLYRHVRDGGEFEKGVLLGAYDYSLSREILTDVIRDELEKKGHEILEGYFDEFSSEFDKNDISELSVKGVSIPFQWNGQSLEVLQLRTIRGISGILRYFR
jgi:DNA helicase-2/ATP-dependent DNA helicase PcrA